MDILWFGSINRLLYFFISFQPQWQWTMMMPSLWNRYRMNSLHTFCQVSLMFFQSPSPTHCVCYRWTSHWWTGLTQWLALFPFSKHTSTRCVHNTHTHTCISIPSVPLKVVSASSWQAFTVFILILRIIQSNERGWQLQEMLHVNSM